MAQLAERGSAEPALVAAAIAAVLATWSVYALSGAGLIPRLPLLRPVLIAICFIYLARAAALPIMLSSLPGRSPAFLYWSSGVVLVFGIVHLIGAWRDWDQLG